MKKLLTILTLLFCIYANAQGADKVNDIDKQMLEVETEWRTKVDVYIRQLHSDVNNLKSRVESQSDVITQLKIKSLVDSLKIDRLEKQIEYTQSFIKDSVVFITSPPKPIDQNLINEVDFIADAWSINADAYSYNATLGNYAYLYFNLKENLKPNTTYKISFEIKTEGKALINFWFNGVTNDRTNDAEFTNGLHQFEYTVLNDEKNRFGIRARNNNGGSFTISNIKVLEK